jgi:hypothetical protein
MPGFLGDWPDGRCCDEAEQYESCRPGGQDRHQTFAATCDGQGGGDHSDHGTEDELDYDEKRSEVHGCSTLVSDWLPARFRCSDAGARW